MKSKYKIKFITYITLIVIGLVVLVSSVLIVTESQRTAKFADTIIENIIDHEGSIVIPSQGEENLPEFEFFTRETPFQTRFFTVKLNKDGLFPEDVKTDNIAAINETQAIELAIEVITEKNKSKGFINGYRYGYKEKEEDYFLVFVDCQRELESSKTMIRNGILVAIGVVILDMILLLIIVNKIIKKTSENLTRQKQFITDASHELKTPLTIISANNEIIEMESGESDSTRSISKQVSRMNVMVKNLTQIAKISEISNNLKTKKVNFTDCVLECLTSFMPSFENNQKEVIMNVAENINIRANDEAIKQCLNIVFENAAKYSKEKVEVKLERISNKAVFTLTNDTNYEINNDLSTVFERFYRNENVRAKGIEGSGVGLSLAKEIVEVNKGKISVKSTNPYSFSIVISFKLY